MPLLNTSALGPARTLIRRARPADLPRLVAAADQIFRTPVKPGLGSMGHDYPLLFCDENTDNLYVAETAAGPRDTEPPAIIGHTGLTLGRAVVEGRSVRVACVGAVFTLPDHRNLGVATRLLDAAVAGARAAGADLGLVSGARGLYASAGFAAYPPVRRYRVSAAANDGRSGRRAASPHVELEPYEPAALPDLARLQEAEPVRFVRSLDEWRRLLAARVLFFEPGAVFSVRRREGADGRRVAYMAVGRPTSEDGLHQQARVLELAGDRAAIAAAAPLLLDSLGVSSLDILMPAHDASLEPHAHELGWSRDELQLPFSAAWWNPSLAHLPLPFYGLNYV